MATSAWALRMRAFSAQAMIQTGDHRPAVKTVRIPWTAVLFCRRAAVL